MMEQDDICSSLSKVWIDVLVIGVSDDDKMTYGMLLCPLTHG